MKTLTTARQSWIPLAIAAVGVALSLAVAYHVGNIVRSDAADRFEDQVKDTTAAISYRLAAYSQILYGARGLFAASDDVTAVEWARYFAAIDPGRNFPGIHSLGFIRHVVDAGGGPPSYPIEYIEPAEHRRMIGIDRGEDTAIRQVLELARDSGLPAVTGRLASQLEQGEPARVLLVLPIYRNGMPIASPAERRTALAGFVNMRVGIADLLQGVLGRSITDELAIEIYDGGSAVGQAMPAARERLIFSSQPEDLLHALQSPDGFAFSKAVSLQVFGRHRLLFFADRSHHAIGPAWALQTVAIGAGGAAFFLLLAAFVRLRLTAHLKAEQAQQESRQRLRAILDNIPDHAWLKDADGRYIAANETMAQVCGLPAEAIIGKTDADIWPADMAEVCRRDDREVMATGQRKVVEEHVVAADGRSFWVEAVKTPIRDAGGTVVGTVGIARDISERRRSEEMMTCHVAELARVNAELDEFIYLASHDLQEPLRKMVAFSDLICREQGDGLPDQLRQDLGRIAESARHMQELIRGLLLLCRAAKTSLLREPVALDQIADAALANLALKMADAGAVVERDPLPETTGDSLLLTQLYQNLIDNALKFSPETPRIHLTAERQVGSWVLGVRDRGIGVDPDQADTIFQPFKRLHRKVGRYSGSGIGLAICRKVVERHKGRIWAEAAAGGGTHFRFTLGTDGEGPSSG